MSTRIGLVQVDAGASCRGGHSSVTSQDCKTQHPAFVRKLCPAKEHFATAPKTQLRSSRLIIATATLRRMAALSGAAAEGARRGLRRRLRPADGGPRALLRAGGEEILRSRRVDEVCPTDALRAAARQAQPGDADAEKSSPMGHVRDRALYSCLGLGDCHRPFKGQRARLRRRRQWAGSGPILRGPHVRRR